MQAHHAKFQRCTSPRASGDGAAAGRDSCGFAHRCADRQDRLNALEDGCALAMAAPRGERPRRRRLPNPALWVALCAVAGALACAALLVRGVPATALLGVRPVAPRAWLSEQTQYTGAAGRASAVPGRKASAARIAYAGIVPYVKRQGAARAHPVACDAGSSVGCVLSAAERGVLRAMASGDRRGPGRLAVEQAAKGKGFAPWDVSHQTKATRLKARRAVEASSGHGKGLSLSVPRPPPRIGMQPGPRTPTCARRGAEPMAHTMCRARLAQLPLAPGRQSRPRDRLRRAAAARACPARVRKARVCKGAREGGRGAREGGEGNGLGHFDYGKPPGVCARGAGTDRQRKREREREREGATGIELWRVYFHCGGFILSSLSKLDYVN